MSNYPVGYRKPPPHSRFEKGKSGNPKGRPKGAKGLSTSLQKIFDKTVVVKERGTPRKIPITEAVGLRLTEKALQGYPRAIKEFMILQQRYEATIKAAEEDLTRADPPKIVFTWASPFDPEHENLSYLTDEEIKFLRIIMDKRDAYQTNRPYQPLLDHPGYASSTDQLETLMNEI